jgi:hypothetical protein
VPAYDAPPAAAAAPRPAWECAIGSISTTLVYLPMAPSRQPPRTSRSDLTYYETDSQIECWLENASKWLRQR